MRTPSLGHGGLRRLFAAGYDPLTAIGDRLFLGPYRRWLLDGLEGRVLFVGLGTGWSLEHLTAREQTPLAIHSIEPDAYLHRRAQHRATELDLEINLIEAIGESLPYDTNSFDTVVCSLVLCTVADPDRVRAEIARVLTPTGEVRLLEHVNGRGLRGRAQRWLAPIWRPLAGGCHLDRRQHEGFLTDPAFETIEHVEHDVGIFPIKPIVTMRLRQIRGSRTA